MTEADFETILNDICAQLTQEAEGQLFADSKEFETRVRTLVIEAHADLNVPIPLNPPAQGFPDIAAGKFGIEVKFTTNDTWRSVANSVLESNRVLEVEKVYIVFGKMGGIPEVKWGEYEKSVMHVRTSHVPRFEVEVFPVPSESLFQKMQTSYDAFRVSPMEDKMQHIRGYARSRLREGERLWWLENTNEPEHTLPIQARLYTKLPKPEKTRLRAEAALLSPRVVAPSGTKNKYDDVVLFLLTYHGVLSYQGRDLFSAGSVGNPGNKQSRKGTNFIKNSLQDLESEMLVAAPQMEAALFEEYWRLSCAPDDRIAQWLLMADDLASGWVPSASMFLDYQLSRSSQAK